MSTLNFFKGYASTALIPKQAIATASKKVLLDSDYDAFDADPNNQHPLNYGTDPGNLAVRSSIAAWGARAFGRSAAEPDCLSLTNGASFGIADLLLSCTDKDVTRKAFIVSPCYFLINYAFVDAGLGDQIVAIHETPGGEFDIDFAELERQLEAADPTDYADEEPHLFADELGRPAKKVYSSVIYIVPTYSNPGGLTYSEATRRKLLQLARKHDMLVICDDVYELLNHSEPTAVPRMCYLDRDTLPAHKSFGNVVSNASTSKLVAPGLRFGWIESATPKLAYQLSQVGATKSGGTGNQLSSFVIKELIDSGELDKIIANYKDHYHRRAQVFRECVTLLPKSVEVSGGDGGYFFWVKFPASVDHNCVVDALAAKGVVLASGDNFSVHNDKTPLGHCVRVCISFLDEHQIRAGVELWAQELRSIYPELY